MRHASLQMTYNVLRVAQEANLDAFTAIADTVCGALGSGGSEHPGLQVVERYMEEIKPVDTTASEPDPAAVCASTTQQSILPGVCQQLSLTVAAFCDCVCRLCPPSHPPSCLASSSMTWCGVATLVLAPSQPSSTPSSSAWASHSPCGLSLLSRSFPPTSLRRQVRHLCAVVRVCSAAVLLLLLV